MTRNTSTTDQVNRSWVDWWKTERVIHDVNWRMNMEFFLRATNRIWRYAPDDVVLDIGCGPGYLPLLLEETVKEIHCLDTSQRYIDVCRQRFASRHNVYTHKLDEENYTDLSFLPAGKFSKILCLSVVQYYRTARDIESLIQEVRRVARPGAQFLIADVPVKPIGVVATLAWLRLAFKESCFIGALSLLCRSLTSSYAKVYSSIGVLVIPTSELRRLARRVGVDAEIIGGPLTLNSDRGHVLITF